MRVFNTKNLCSKIVITIFYGYFGARLLWAAIFPVTAAPEEVGRRATTSICQTIVKQIKPPVIKVTAVNKEKSWQGVCSWYGLPFHGRLMASGKVFDMNNPVHAAHRTLPFGTKLEITNLANQKKLVVTILDRGPFTKNQQGKYARDLDLSYAAAHQLDFVDDGLAKIKIRILA